MLSLTRPLMEIPDDPVLARCRAGDVDAFGLLYAEHEVAVFRHAYRMLGCREDAGDLCQETFVRAFHGLSAFRGDCTVRVWLLRICTNLCRNALRTRSRRREVPLDQPTDAYPADACGDPAAAFEQQQRVALLHEALAALSPTHRELIVLRDLEGLSSGEIAAIVGCSVASVPVKLFRARSGLKRQLMRLLREKE